MEKPLLSGESSRATAARRKREHHNRSKAIAYGSNVEKAAALVDLVRFILCFTFFTFYNVSNNSSSFPFKKVFIFWGALRLEFW